jgi:hypothetical protein
VGCWKDILGAQKRDERHSEGVSELPGDPGNRRYNIDVKQRRRRTKLKERTMGAFWTYFLQFFGLDMGNNEE